MVSRYDIRVATYNEIENVLDGIVPSDNITGEMPHKPEDYPAVTHSHSFEPLDWNRGGAAPIETTYDSNGNVETETYSNPTEATFTLTCSAVDDGDHEEIHGTLKNHFRDLSTQHTRTTALHPDIFSVDVGESTSVNAPNRSRKVFATEFEVVIGFEIFRIKDLSPLQSVDIEYIDIDAF